ncbi:MAG: translation initiation factor IF-3 [Proteobacteria bacterium]|nr:translation initiation factor IF-3 [Pseudomonadota bacterium]
MKSRTPEKTPSKDGPRVNRDIMARQVRLIDQNDEMQGIVATPQALEMAEAVGLDLVEISPNAEPPVCKILDYGKYKYEMHKKAAVARKKQKVIDVKEIKLRPTIDDNDFNIKMRSAKGFLTDGDKVKVTLRFRGREMAHQELGLQLLTRVKETLAALARVEYDAKFEGRQIVMILAPADSK